MTGLPKNIMRTRYLTFYGETVFTVPVNNEMSESDGTDP